MNAHLTDQTPHCPECGSGNVAMKTIRLSDSGTHPIQNSYWFKCAACQFSTSGRLSQDEAQADMKWQVLGRPYLPTDAELARAEARRKAGLP